MCIFLFLKMHISSPNLILNQLLESSHQNDSNKWSNIGFGEEILQVELIKVDFTKLIWSSDASNHRTRGREWKMTRCYSCFGLNNSRHRADTSYFFLGTKDKLITDARQVKITFQDLKYK